MGTVLWNHIYKWTEDQKMPWSIFFEIFRAKGLTKRIFCTRLLVGHNDQGDALALFGIGLWNKTSRQLKIQNWRVGTANERRIAEFNHTTKIFAVPIYKHFLTSIFKSLTQFGWNCPSMEIWSSSRCRFTFRSCKTMYKILLHRIQW